MLAKLRPVKNLLDNVSFKFKNRTDVFDFITRPQGAGVVAVPCWPSLLRDFFALVLSVQSLCTDKRQ